MEIKLQTNHYGFNLIIEADNVKINEDIESREYQKDADGKLDFNKAPNRDIKTEALEQFSTLLGDMIYCRKAEFESSDLMELLFDKLPIASREKIVNKLTSNL